jgi:DNA mismatch repair protein MutL
MNRIRLLPEQVANQIAAGEVVERPASVVKELVENALDAEATRISVEIHGGGRSLIRVTDDGVGMSRDDALLCLERHATSKIRRAEDLQAIKSMGFRGEALPSLASVSRLMLTTRERGSDAVAATEVTVHGGKIMSVKEAGAPSGTCIEARQLFFNLPARRKFLRSEETERAHIQHYLILAALANPWVAFSFTNDERLVWQLPGLKAESHDAAFLEALKERWRALYGSNQGLLELNDTATLEVAGSSESEAAGYSAPLQILGLIGAPGLSRSTRENQHLFVNRRPVENRGLNFALLEGYHTALMKGRYPVACLFVEVDPAEVDVNIHPSKREVKFRHESSVRQLVTQAIRKVLLAYHAQSHAPATNASHQQLEAIQGVGSGLAAGTTNRAPSTAPEPRLMCQPLLASAAEAKTMAGAGAGTVGTPKQGPLVENAVPSAMVGSVPQASGGEAAGGEGAGPRTALPPHETAPAAVQPRTASAPGAEAVPLLAVPLRLVGVVGRLYVVLESDRGMVLMDQHAAHERILYEQMLKRLEENQAPSQRLLLAHTIEVAPHDIQFLREQIPIFTRLGVGLSEFGERTFLLDALPPYVRAVNATQFILDIVDELKAAGQTVNSWRLGEHTVAKTVCRHAVKAHDPLSVAELQKLVDDLRQCTMPYTCPHGRPTLVEMNFRELQKRFGRTL